ncbi:MAG: RHS repeat protein, partial [Clostridia bacterium]|nr:RHS repeat protein [Clostridia bacterium]
MKHKVIRLLSIVCALSILIVTMPVTAYAQTVDVVTDTDKTISTVLPEEEEQTPVTILEEEVEMREQNVKYFRCDDGTILAAVYNNPIHYRVDNRWEDIDNSLTTTNSKNGITYYTNKANDLKVRIPENLSETAPVEVENRGFALQWIAVDSQSERVQLPVIRPSSGVLSQASAGDTTVTNLQKAIETKNDNGNQTQLRFANEHKTYIEKQNTDVTYANVYDKTDIRYTIVSNKLKESIVFETLPTKTSFAFFMQGAGLTAVLQQDNSVHFYAKETEEVIFVIAAPYMYDNDGEHSDDIVVTLVPQRDGWLYTLTPSREWLADANRAYPVTLDPTVEPATNDNNMEATEIYSGKPNNNYGSSDKMFVGGYVADNKLFECRALVKFDLPALSSEYSNMQIVNAQIKMTNSSTGTPNDISEINMYQVTESWSESTVTWNNRPQTDDIVEDLQFGQSGAGESVFDITALANAWAKDSTTNYGVAFAAVGADTYVNAVQWYTEDAATTANRPAVTISYRECVGLEDYWTYTSMSVGRGASASVNNATGALTIVIPDCGIDGNLMPVSISHVHNTSFTKVATYGGKFRLNYQMSVTATDIAEYPYYFIDGDGTKHYFKENENEIKDEDGLGLTLTETDDNTDEKFVITAKDKSKMVFNADGNLRFIRDTNNNEIEIVYNNGVIHQIIDGADRIYQFAYDENGRLASITDPAGRQTTYAYNSWDELNTIYYPDGNVVNVFYNNAKVQRLRGNGQTV